MMRLDDWLPLKIADAGKLNIPYLRDGWQRPTTAHSGAAGVAQGSPTCCIAEFHSAALRSSRNSTSFHGQRIGNPRFSRLAVCATRTGLAKSVRLALAKRQRLCEKFGINSAVHQMSRPESRSHLRLAMRWLKRWVRLALVVLALFPVPALSADVPPANTNWIFEATNHLGQWIWDTNTLDKQTCRLWKAFEIPRGAKIASAILRI